MTSGADDAITVVAAGVTVYSCLEAGKRLAAKGVSIRLIDAYSIKPIDQGTLLDAVEATEGRLVVVEDHHPEGGLGEAVLASVAGAGKAIVLEHVAVRNLPSSGEPADLLKEAGIDAEGAYAACVRVLNRARLVRTESRR
jgi:transketolase